MKLFRTCLGACVATLALGCMQVLFAFTPVPHVPFMESMNHHGAFNHKLLKNSSGWRHLAQLYNCYQTSKPHLHNRYLIPQQIHFIWLKGALPKHCKQNIATWKKFHPNWEITIWTRADLETFNLRNKHAFLLAKTLKDKATIWSYEILHRLGGVYATPNFECLREFDALHMTSEFYTGIRSANTPPQVCNNLIGCKPHHPIIELCMSLIGQQSQQGMQQMTGSDLFTHCFDHHAGTVDPTTVAFPVTFFYPVPAEAKKEGKHVPSKWITPETFAVQH